MSKPEKEVECSGHRIVKKWTESKRDIKRVNEVEVVVENKLHMQLMCLFYLLEQN